MNTLNGEILIQSSKIMGLKLTEAKINGKTEKAPRNSL